MAKNNKTSGNLLLLGSSSLSRQMLLREAQIPFVLVSQDADESHCDWGVPLPQLVAQLARYKMAHVVMPAGQEGDVCFVLTADTLSQDSDGSIQGKPVDRKDAYQKLIKARSGSRLCTAFCLDKRKMVFGGWQLVKRIEKVVEARYIFHVPDCWLEVYLEQSYGLVASNAIAIEGFGGQFLRQVQGSYTTIVGLPMFELRESLEELGFFS